MNTNNKSLLYDYMKRELNILWSGKPAELTEEEAKQYHPATDIAFLERLDADAISDHERVELLEHLNKCVFCRQKMELLCKCGAMFTDGVKTTVPRPVHTQLTKFRLLSPLTIAACLFLVVGVTLYFSSSGSPSQVAHRKVAGMLKPDEKNLSTLLTDHGYRLSGTSSIKAVTTIDDHKQTVRSAYEKLLADYPDEIDFRTEFGKYLLFVMKESDLARNELEKALEASLTPSELKRVPQLHLLLGLAAFEERDDVRAQKHFRDVLDLNPQNIDAKVNLAISFYRSGDKEQAVEMFNALRSESIPVTLRDLIDKFLERE